MQKKIATLALAVAAALSTSGAYSQVNLTAETAGPGTVVHLAPTSLVEYAAERGIANIQLKDGQTTTNYLLAMAEGKTDIASGPFILPFLLSRGAGPYANIGSEQGGELAANVRLLYPYTLGVFYLHAYDSKGISGWDDLAGRKILNGPPTGGATANSRNLIRIFAGLQPDTDYESVTVNWGQAAATVVDGTADAALIPELFPSGRITQESAAGAMTAYSMPADIFESEDARKLLNKPGSSAFEIPVSEVEAGLGDTWTVISEDDTFRGMAVVGGDMVNASMDDELAYQLAKAHIENIADIEAKAPFASYANFGVLDPSVAGLCGANQVKFHAGAVRAWEEAGYTVPDCSKP